MDIKHCLLIKKGESTIGLFYKILEMPCLPHAGTLVYFGEKTKGFPQEIIALSYYEETGIYSAYYELDVLEEQGRLNDYISDEYFPKKFVNEFNFEVDWLEEPYENEYSNWFKSN